MNQQSNDEYPSTSTPVKSPEGTADDSVVELNVTNVHNTSGKPTYSGGATGLSGEVMPSGLLRNKNNFIGLPVPSDFLSRFV